MVPGNLFKYPGSKFLLGRKLAPFLKRVKYYVEPFGGSMGFLWGLASSPEYDYASSVRQVIYNDVDPVLCAFFRVLAGEEEDFLSLGERICKLVSKDVYKQKLEILRLRRRVSPEEDPRVTDEEVATAFYYVNALSFSGKEGCYRPGAYSLTYHTDKLSDPVVYLRPFRDFLRQRIFSIENQDFRQVLEILWRQRKKGRLQETLFFVDPPYFDVEGEYYPVLDELAFKHLADYISRFVQEGGHVIVTVCERGKVLLETFGLRLRSLPREYTAWVANAEEKPTKIEYILYSNGALNLLQQPKLLEV